jgi:hypothetical protein
MGDTARLGSYCGAKRGLPSKLAGMKAAATDAKSRLLAHSE